MVPSVPSGVAVTVVAVASLIPLSGFLTIAFGARAAGLAGWPRLAGYVAAGLLAWGGLGVALAALEIGWGAAYRLTPVLLALAYALPVLLVVAALRRAPRLRTALGTRSALWRLASIQLARNVGLVFLVLHARGELPGLFTYPAAWGDVAIGVTAPIAMWALWFRDAEVRRPGSGWRKAFIGWNVAGLADHVVAVTLGILCFPGALHVFDVHPTTVVFAGLPMVLFPIYMVPFAAMGHRIMLDAIRRPAGRARRDGVAERVPVLGGAG